MKMSDNLTKYEVLIEQYLRSILDISGTVTWRKFQLEFYKQKLDYSLTISMRR